MIQTIAMRVQHMLVRLTGGSRSMRIGVWLITLLSAALVVQLVQLLFAILTPSSPVGAWRPRAAIDMPAEAKREMFARMDPFYRTAPAAEAAPAAVTGLQLQLFGIRVNEAAGTGSAIIAGSDGIQNSIGVGEEIQPGVRLVGVHFDYVEIEQNGKKELLYLDQSQAPGAAASGQALTSSPAGPRVNTAAASAAPAAPISPNSLRAGIAFTPRTEGSRVTGIRVGEQADGAAFRAAGFRNGDVIRAVNGRPITSASDVANLASQLQPGARLSLDVERGAGTVPIAIIIPNGNP